MLDSKYRRLGYLSLYIALQYKFLLNLDWGIWCGVQVKSFCLSHNPHSIKLLVGQKLILQDSPISSKALIYVGQNLPELPFTLLQLQSCVELYSELQKFLHGVQPSWYVQWLALGACTHPMGVFCTVLGRVDG